MNTKNKGSVAYISFGTICVLSKSQMEEIAGGLLDSGRPFLWVITEKQYPEGKKEEDELSCLEELEKLGKIVSWCPQMEVLSRPSFGCFVTLRLEFNVGELGLWGSNGGIPTMDGPRNQCQID